jgi:cytoskeleton protein RodZ
VNADNGLPRDAGPAGEPTAGALLKAAREKQGLHIAALAAAIKVSPRKLEALEANRLDELPDLTFTRALAQTVCRTLKVDPRPVLDRLPAPGLQALVPVDEGLNQPFREGMARTMRAHEESPLRGLAMRPMLWGALLLLVASVLLYLVPLDGWLGRGGSEVAAPLPVASAPALAPALAASAMAPAASALPAAELPASAATAAASAAVLETVFSSPPAGNGPASPPPAGALVLRVTEASWIEVRDRRGVALLSRTVTPGEQLGLDGPGPLLVVVGNVAATELVFRGQPVDLAPHNRDNVARFQLP